MEKKTVRMAAGLRRRNYSLGWINAFRGRPRRAKCVRNEIAIDPDFVEAMGHLASLPVHAGPMGWKHTRWQTRDAIDFHQPVAMTAVGCSGDGAGQPQKARRALVGRRLGDVSKTCRL